MERDAFHILYWSDKIREAVFNSQVVKTVAYLTISTAQQDVRSQHPRQQTNRGEAGRVDLPAPEHRPHDALEDRTPAECMDLNAGNSTYELST